MRKDSAAEAPARAIVHIAVMQEAAATVLSDPALFDRNHLGVPSKWGLVHSPMTSGTVIRSTSRVPVPNA